MRQKSDENIINNEAVQASQTFLRNKSAPLPTTVNVVIRSSCSNCGLHPPPKSCPAYKDRYLTWGVWVIGRNSVENQGIFQKVDSTKTDSQHQRWKQSQEVGKENSK